MIKVFVVALILSINSFAATVLLPEESITEWIDIAPSGRTLDELSLNFTNSQTRFTISNVIRRGSELRLFLRSEGVQAKKIELINTKDAMSEVLISVNRDSESFFEGAGGTIIYDYSASIFFSGSQFDDLRDANLQIEATPVFGSSFESVPEPSSSLLFVNCLIFFAARRSKRRTSLCY